MAAWKLDDICAESVASNLPQAIGVHELIIAANNRSTTSRRELSQRKRHSGRVSCLRPKAIESSHGGRLVTIGEQERPSKFEIDPCCSILRIKLAQPLHVIRVQHRLVTPLIDHAPADVRNHGAQVHQMPYWSAGRD